MYTGVQHSDSQRLYSIYSYYKISDYIPFVVQYILVAYFIPTHLAPSPLFALPTGDH